MATHSSVLVWRIPWTEEPGGLQSMWSQRVRHDSVTKIFTFKKLICGKFFFMIIKTNQKESREIVRRNIEIEKLKIKQKTGKYNSNISNIILNKN